MRITVACTILFLAGLSALPGCGLRRPQVEGTAQRGGAAKEQSSGPAQPVDTDSFPMRTISSDGSYVVVCRPRPDPIPLNELFELDLFVLHPRLRTPVGEVRVMVDADMPEHRHGMNTRPQIRPNPDGSLRVSGMHLFMPGYWEIYVDIERDGVIERAQFGLTLE